MRSHSLFAFAWGLLTALPAYAAVETGPPVVAAPITSVTVYSDRARVTRTAKLRLSGEPGGQKLALPWLFDRVDPSTIRVTAYGPGAGAAVQVERVDIARIEPSELQNVNQEEATALRKSLEELDDQLSRFQSEERAYRDHLELLRKLVPPVPPSPSPSPVGAAGAETRVRLSPGSFLQAMDFVKKSRERLQGKLVAVEEQLRELRKKRQTVSAKLAGLGKLERRGGYRVSPVLTGAGPVTVEISYLTYGARWQPSYDIQLHPDRETVELRLSGLVSQETGEDWDGVDLLLSTAVPATTTQLPQLTAWRLGERERFVPTPPRLPAPRVAELDEAERVPRAGESVDSDHDGIRDVEDKEAKKEEVTKTKGKKTYDFDQEVVEGDLIRPDGEFIDTRRMPAAEAPPPAPPPPMGGLARSYARISQSVRNQSVAQREVTVLGSGLVPPPGYSSPYYGKDSAAGQSGGFDLSYAAATRDSVKSGQGARRVALLVKSFPVKVARRVVPALADEAFLVAELKNPSREPLPGGQAQLFVGADPAGVAQLSLISPGESFTLPLGIDRALRPRRSVRMNTVEKGVFNKDEITEYVVTTELENPYRTPITVRVSDQLPLSGNKDVEVRLLKSEPPVQPDPVKGSLDFVITVAAGSKTTVSYTYTLRRPKGYRLTQG